MKAIRVEQFGGPEVLRLVEMAVPEPGPRQVLIRVHAAGVNPRKDNELTGGNRGNRD